MKQVNGNTLNVVMRAAIILMIGMLGFFAKQAYEDNRQTQKQLMDKLNQLDEDGDKMRGDILTMATILRDRGYKIPDQIGSKIMRGDKR